jgi:hypothetical protein
VDLQERHGLAGTRSETPILTTPSRSFVVGRLESKFPSPVQFFGDRVEYQFHHPYDRKVVSMVMYYRDMSNAMISDRKRELQFKIMRRLEEFGDDYDYRQHTHVVSIGFGSSADVSSLRGSNLIERMR